VRCVFFLFFSASLRLRPFAPARAPRSTVISQLIYSAGTSGFAGVNGSMMIEVVVRRFSSAFLGQDAVT
jgi:hypothetical protein